MDPEMLAFSLQRQQEREKAQQAEMFQRRKASDYNRRLEGLSPSEREDAELFGLDYVGKKRETESKRGYDTQRREADLFAKEKSVKDKEEARLEAKAKAREEHASDYMGILNTTPYQRLPAAMAAEGISPPPAEIMERMADAGLVPQAARGAMFSTPDVKMGRPVEDYVLQEILKATKGQRPPGMVSKTEKNRLEHEDRVRAESERVRLDREADAAREKDEKKAKAEKDEAKGDVKYEKGEGRKDAAEKRAVEKDQAGKDKGAKNDEFKALVDLEYMVLLKLWKASAKKGAVLDEAEKEQMKTTARVNARKIQATNEKNRADESKKRGGLTPEESAELDELERLHAQ
jgi:hypothetical protein